jgi:hypothetical protein
MSIKKSLPTLGIQPFSNIRFIIGTGQTKDGVEINAGFRSILVREIRTHIAKLFGGYTETSGHGGWYDADRGVLVEESNVIFDVAIIPPPAFREFVTAPQYRGTYYLENIAKAQDVVDHTKRILDQACVLVQFSYGQSAIV